VRFAALGKTQILWRSVETHAAGEQKLVLVGTHCAESEYELKPKTDVSLKSLMLGDPMRCSVSDCVATATRSGDSLGCSLGDEVADLGTKSGGWGRLAPSDAAGGG